MSDQTKSVNEGGRGRKPQPATPKAIAARTQSRNSLTRLVIGGGVLLLLCAALIITVSVKSDAIKDILLVIGTLGAYMLGTRSEQTREERK